MKRDLPPAIYPLVHPPVQVVPVDVVAPVRFSNERERISVGVQPPIRPFLVAVLLVAVYFGLPPLDDVGQPDLVRGVRRGVRRAPGLAVFAQNNTAPPERVRVSVFSDWRSVHRSVHRRARAGARTGEEVGEVAVRVIAVVIVVVGVVSGVSGSSRRTLLVGLPGLVGLLWGGVFRCATFTIAIPPLNPGSLTDCQAPAAG